MNKKSLINFALIILICIGIVGLGVALAKPSGTTNHSGSHSHSYNRKVTTDKYLATSATCTASAEYYYSCKCGAKGTQTFTSGEPTEHNYYHTNYCTVCGQKGEDIVIELWTDNWFSSDGAKAYLYYWHDQDYSGWVEMELITDDGAYGDNYKAVITEHVAWSGFKIVRFDGTSENVPSWDGTIHNQSVDVLFTDYQTAINTNGYFAIYC